MAMEGHFEVNSSVISTGFKYIKQLIIADFL